MPKVRVASGLGLECVGSVDVGSEFRRDFERRVVDCRAVHHRCDQHPGVDRITEIRVHDFGGRLERDAKEFLDGHRAMYRLRNGYSRELLCHSSD